ncbi:unnamed protein product [Oncorhynchus mykiss]|uniref:C2H2-type domain-containing protein n=1 Tax=Oncorhynchus mykiss TaxID=8022 RepID=A0A060XLY0_ONCMY|nr:unnamed protein product [Oncorhynchus mykiss]
MEDVSAVTIKDEGGDEQESEDVSENLTKKTENSANKPAKDDSTDGDGLFRCLDCEEVFGEEAAYQEHQHEHTHDGPIVCLDSDSHLDGLLVSESGGQRTLCCALCGRKFADSRGFYSHQVKHRNEALKQSTPVLQSTPVAQSTVGPQSTPDQSMGVAKQYVYECEDCGKSYTSMGSFISHTRSHKQASKSVFHELAHLKKKSFECQTCGRCYSRSSALDAHRRCHEVKLIPKSRKRDAEKQPPAEEPAFATEDSNKASEQVDEAQENLFGCSCGKTFRAQSGLKTHQRFSHNEKCSPEKLKRKPNKFDCSECEKTFSTYAGMLCHQRYHMKRGGSGGKRFPCEECDKVFTTLTFYYKHQRLAHTQETPAKSFLHQVCQLQKKAFECQECGLRFSRASALQSHRLCHNDVFGQTEKEFQPQTSPLPQHKLLLDNKTETETFALGAIVYPQDTLQTPVTERDPCFYETDGDAEADGTDDVNVEVISISASDGSVRDEEESQQELNPDLELLCESDQEGKEEMDAVTLKSKPEIDLKIVQIDFPPFVGEGTQTEKVQGLDPPKRFNCPECYRWFTSAASLRSHKLWHRVDGKKRWNPEKDLFKCDFCGFDTTHRKTYHNHMRKHDGRKPHKSVLYQLAGLQKNSFKCEVCGKCFSRMSALHSHQQQHPKSKAHPCPDCEKTYSNASGLYNHRKSCHAPTPTQDEVSDTKTEVFNPKKTLLGPTVYCERCGKGFWSLGAYAHHKQNQAPCAHLKEKNEPTVSSHSVNGPPHVRGKVACPVCRKTFRHQGIMKSHMRKHENGNHRCELCSKSFRMFSSLLRHQVVHNAQILPPPIKSFQHQVEQVKKNAYSCPDCGKLFSRAKALKFHMKSHGYETDYSASSPKSALELEGLKCSTCLSHFSNKSSLHTHQKQCGKKNTVIKSHKEDIETNESLTLKKAATINTTDLKYKCKECERSFAVVGALNFHKRIHVLGHKSKVKPKLKFQVAAIPEEPKQPKKVEQTTKGQFCCPECGRHLQGDQSMTMSIEEVPEQPATSHSKSEVIPLKKPKLKSNLHQCPHCDMSFLKVRGLRAHKWQAHSQGKKVKSKGTLAESGDSTKGNELINESKDLVTENKGTVVITEHFVTKNKNAVGRRRKKGRPGLKSIPCVDCGKRYSSSGALYNHKKICGVLKQEVNPGMAEVVEEEPSPPTRLYEQTIKYLFKCDKCGKAFPTEEQLGTHKDLAKSRPHSCALCCRGYWTEAQLQQHLAWHDEVRRRLPTELRYRLSASVSTGPAKLNVPLPDLKAKSSLKPLPTRPSRPQNSHKCQHCGKAFLSPGALHKHEAQHDSDGSYRCSLCPRTFSEIRDLIDHHQECMGDDKVQRDPYTAVSSRDTDGLTCIECGMRFSRELELHQHYIEHARGAY